MILLALLLALPDAIALAASGGSAGGGASTLPAAGGGQVPWGAIVVHRSGEASGSAASIDRFQRETLRDPDGIDHHFVIGNGDGAEDGSVEATAPWLSGKKTSHLFRAPGLPPAISICLVGAFDSDPTEAQRAALVELVAALAARFSISAERVLLHHEVEKTVCPGTIDKGTMLVGAKLVKDGPVRFVIDSGASRATLFAGEIPLQRFSLSRAPKAPGGTFAVCRKDEAGAFGKTLVLAWPTIADVESAAKARRLGAEDARRLRDELRAGRCPPDDTPLGGELGIHATTSVDEEGTCLQLDAKDLELVYRALPLGALVEVQ